jgi:hypothetical protein
VAAQCVSQDSTGQRHHAGSDFPGGLDAGSSYYAASEQDIPNLGQHYDKALGEPVKYTVSTGKATNNKRRSPSEASMFFIYLQRGMMVMGMRHMGSSS